MNTIEKIDLLTKQLSSAIETLEEVRLAIQQNWARDEKPKGREVCMCCKEPILPREESGKTRGCHQRCYKLLYRAWQDGSMTEQQAIDRGLIQPAYQAGRKRAVTKIDKILGTSATDDKKK